MSTTRTVERGERDRLVEEGCCPECGNDLEASDRETYCPDCGLVLEERAFDPEDVAPATNRSRFADLHHDRGLGNGFIAQVSRTGTKLISKQDDRLREWNRRVLAGSGRERTMDYACGEVKRIAEALDLPFTVQQQAGRLVQQASEEGVTNGQDMDGIATAAIVIAARVDGAPVTRADALEYARCTEDSMTSAFDAMRRDLGLPIPPASPVTFVGRIVDTLELSATIRSEAEAVAEAVHGTAEMSGRKPSGMAAACVYYVVREIDGTELTQAEVAEAADCHLKTIQNNNRVLREVDP